MVATSTFGSALDQPGTAAADVRDFRKIVDEHASFIWRVLRRLGLAPSDADDASQQVFMIFAQKRDRVPEERIRSFLYGSALRVARNFRRGVERRSELAREFRHAGGADVGGPEEQAELVEARDRLDRLLSQLPEPQRRVMILVEVEQLEVAEAAKLEGIPQGTAASRLRLARARFGDLLAALEREDRERSP